MAKRTEKEIPPHHWENRDGEVVPMVPDYGTCPDHPGVHTPQPDGTVLVTGAAAVLLTGCTVAECRHNRNPPATEKK